MKKLHSQSGFGVAVVVLIVAVIAAIGGVGYFVWNQNTEPDQTSSVQQDLGNDENRDQIQSSLKPENWTEFIDEQIGLTLPYPKEWGDMSVTSVDWKHNGEGFLISFSASDVKGMAVSDTYEYTDAGRGGASWELNNESFNEIVSSTTEADEKAKTDKNYSTRVIENKVNFIVAASGDCVSDGAVSIATYNVKDTKNSKVSLLRLSAPAISQPSDCFDVTRDNVLDFVDTKTQQQFIELGSLL